MSGKSEKWARAYVAQAQEDIAAAKAVATVAPSTFLMLMQMVFEKTAKAVLLAGDRVPPKHLETSHVAISKVLTIIRRYHREEYAAFGLKRMNLTIREIEMLHPQVAKRRGGPRLEYPWRDPATGEIRWPAGHLPLSAQVIDPTRRTGSELVKCAQALIHRYDILA